jgi:uncharacterized protein YndB with AHSA1/START domain
MYHLVQDLEATVMKQQLRVAVEATSSANPDQVWSLVADANSYPQWGPWNDGGYRPSATGPARPGSIQWFRYGRRTVSVEEILEVEPARRLVYALVEGLPVKNYRAEVSLTPTPTPTPKPTPTATPGTTIRWSATWDDTVLGRIVHRKLRQLYPEIVQALASAANQRSAEQSRAAS